LNGVLLVYPNPKFGENHMSDPLDILTFIVVSLMMAALVGAFLQLIFKSGKKSKPN